MKNGLFALILLTSFSSYAKKYNLKLTFIDGYTNEAIVNEKVTVRIISLDWSEEFVTNSKGRINFNFNAENFIQYNFQFASHEYQFQTRQRYLGDESNIDLTFELYPSKKYERLISNNESTFLTTIPEEVDGTNCIESSIKVDEFLTELFIDEHLQVPYWYGDYGFKVEFLVEATFCSTGKPYEVKIIESSDHHLNDEIKRLVRLLPESDNKSCEGLYKKTVQFPIVIDHSIGIEED